jgi:hypothetical protein
MHTRRPASSTARLRWLSLAPLVLTLIACGGTAHPATRTATPEPLVRWPAPPDALARTRAAGLEPLVKEALDYHVHAHLDLFIDGQRVDVPAGIGINIDDPGVQRFETEYGTAYGRIDGCAQPCISPLHTHDRSGVLHTESRTKTPNQLGMFFVEWGVRLDASCVGEYCQPATPIAVYVDGKRYAGNPADIPLTDKLEIAIVIGVPPSVIPTRYDFSHV